MTTFVWHCHHAILVEPLTEPFENRVRYIKEEKPVKEQETRLRLFKIVQGTLPLEVVMAREAYDEALKAREEAKEAYYEAGKACEKTWKAHYEAGEACYEARKALDEAGKAYDEAVKAYYEARKAYDEAVKAYYEARKAYNEAVENNMEEILALHALECPNCPWNGKTIFTD